ncbi:MAG: patatin-like phospholipase family protein [Deltaproteobacteria bacterium]|uniref:Patatin-like phospholipase family protein n=1 Tax=Candidatus Zymogenus saltonus TaxID=2844893 RepID=A0A9D8KGA4_9DELT|nr:patatin-like phospholipase family protein [Candidatus Zymogenus saltonus]
MKRIVFMTIILLLFAVSFISCSVIPDIFTINKLPEKVDEKFSAADDGDFFFAISVSGGGSRAAVWTSSVLYELYKEVKLPDGRSVLDEVDYISCVSGGSLASAYYCMRKPVVDTREKKEYDIFFDNYTEDMRRNFEKEIVSIYKPWQWKRVFLKATDKGVILQRVFDRMLTERGTKNFRDLHERQLKVQCPTIIINGTVMDNGSKFLFTTLRRSDFLFNTFSKTEVPEETAAAWEYILPVKEEEGAMFAGDIGQSIGNMRVSRAVMGSASIPLLFGPIIIEGETKKMPGKMTYFHINDGGIADNLGLETVIQLMLNRFSDPNKRYRGGLVLIIDAGHLIDPKDSTCSIEEFTTGKILGRSLDIFDYRHKYFIYYNILLLQQNPAFRNVRFVYLSPYLPYLKDKDNGNDEDNCSDKDNDKDKDNGEKELKKIGTRFKIDPKSAKLLDDLAKEVVGDMKETILLNFEGKDAPRK